MRYHIMRGLVFMQSVLPGREADSVSHKQIDHMQDPVFVI